MADNVSLNAMSGGATIAADDISSVWHQRVKVEFGADGTATEVSSTNPLPVGWPGGIIDYDPVAAATAVTKLMAPQMLYNGAEWVRPRVPNVLKYAEAPSSGDNNLWTPASGKKFRLLAFRLGFSADVTVSSAGAKSGYFFDGSTSLLTTLGKFYFYLPSTASTTPGFGHSTDWMTFGPMGYLSVAANNILKFNISAGLMTGTLGIHLLGNEEA